jgi:3-phenylpropionate/cinnamic acid dioxygenase small subunit
MSVVADDAALVSDRVYREVSELLFREARLLDAGRFKEWLELLSPDVRYRLVTPCLSMCGAGAHPRGETLLMDETFGSFSARVRQLSTPAFTVAENPRPFTRRFVTNILIDRGTDEGPLHVHSNALVYRSRGTQMEPHVFSMVRLDVFKRVAGTFRLLRRDAQLDESVVGARNITALW